MIKRVFDFIVSMLGLCLLMPLFVFLAIVIKIASPGPVFFLQERIGRGGRPFRIVKFRTMVVNSAFLGGQVTVGSDPRVTGVGRILRKIKLDELPQLFNVIAGHMSLVGPRPEVPRYVKMFETLFQPILTVRPGITDLASLKYRDESALLGAHPDGALYYEKVVLPDKIRLAEAYIHKRSFILDLEIIIRTVFGGGCPRRFL